MAVDAEFIVIGDLHLESLHRFFGPTSDDKIYQCLDQVTEYAQNNGLSSIILTGDIFDHPNPDQETIVRLISYLLKFPKLSWYFIIGNHDIESADKHSSMIMKFVSANKLTSNIHFFDQETEVKVEGIPFFFVPYPNVKTKKTSYPTINILHVETVGAQYENGRKITKGIELAKSDDYHIIGHLHAYQVFPRIVYPGMMFQKTFGDNLNKGFLHCQARWSKTSLKVKPKFIPISLPFRLHNVVVQSLADLKKVEPSTTDFYKLFIKSDFIPPTSWLADHPNVINNPVRFKSKAELDLLKDGSFLLDDVANIDGYQIVVQNLEPFLKSKELSEKQITKATSIVDSILNEIREANS